MGMGTKSQAKLMLLALLMAPLVAQAALVDLTSYGKAGLFYDTVTGLTWTTEIRLQGESWDDATAAAAAYTKYGLTEWRLPGLTTPAGQTPCTTNTNGTTSTGVAHCMDSELADMWYRNLGGVAGIPFGPLDVISGNDIFWMEDVYDLNQAYVFILNHSQYPGLAGGQSYGGKAGGNLFGSWFVTSEYRLPNTDGDGNTVPLPGTLLLVGVGLLALRVVQRRNVAN